MPDITENIVHVDSGKCLMGQNYGDPIILANCDESNNRQRITITNANDQQGAHDMYINGVHINTWQDGFYNANDCGKGNDCSMHVQNQTGGSGAGNGPFQFWGWNSQWRAWPENGTGKILQRAQWGAETWFITQSERKDCDAYGIPLRECTPANRNDCNKYGNYKRDSCKPQVCPKNDGSFLKYGECRDWCRTSGGKCDVAAAAYCAANPTDTGFCGCYNFAKTPKDPALKGINVADYPWCYAPECANNQNVYKPYNYITPGLCPNQTITVCSADFNQTAGAAASMKGITVVQNCSSTGTTSTKDTKTTTDSSGTKTSSTGATTTAGTGTGGTTGTTTSGTGGTTTGTTTSGTGGTTTGTITPGITTLTSDWSSNTTLIYGGAAGTMICCCCLLLLLILMM